MRTLPVIALAVFALALLSGCVASPRPARTEVTPGESEIKSEREERRPSETHLRIRASTPPAPAPQEPPVRIRIILPRQEGAEGGEE